MKKYEKLELPNMNLKKFGNGTILSQISRFKNRLYRLFYFLNETIMPQSGPMLSESGVFQELDDKFFLNFVFSHRTYTEKNVMEPYFRLKVWMTKFILDQGFLWILSKVFH